MLRRGSSGDEVTKLQTDLGSLGHDAGPADGIFGGKTEQAVRDCQGAHGLAADGIAGPQTLGAVAGALAKQALSGGGAPEGEADGPAAL